MQRAGYITRSRERNENGQLGGAEYIIREQPQDVYIPNNDTTPPISGFPMPEKPTSGNPTQVNSMLENPTQLNKEILSKEKLITNLSNTDFIPIHSPNLLPFAGEAATPPERNGKEAANMSAFEIYRGIILENLDYEIMVEQHKYDKDRMFSRIALR